MDLSNILKVNLRPTKSSTNVRVDLENERKGLNYDSENLFAFGFMSSEKFTSTPDSGLMCSDRMNYYLEIIPISNPNYQNVDDTTVGNNFFKINLYTSKSSL